MADTTPIRNKTLPTSTTKADCHQLIDTATVSIDGLLANADFDAGAAIVDSKLATIATNAKVNLSALSITDQAAGDILYSSDGTTFTRLPIGTAGQELKYDFDSYTKAVFHADGTDGGVSFTEETGKTVTNTAAYDSYTKVCSHFDGANGATAYTDPIAGAYTFGGTAQLSTAQKKFGSASLLLDGNSDYVTLPDSADWTFGTDPFTIEGWFRWNSVGDTCFYEQYENALNSFRIIYSAGTVYIYNRESSTVSVNATVTWTPVADIWYHIAFVRNGSNAYFFVNGVNQTVNVLSGNFATSFDDIAGLVYIGARGDSSYYHNGYIDEYRISKGIARWTSNFTPNAYPYGQVVTSTTQKKFGTASAWFDGSGAVLTLADSADWDLGNTWTIDGWFRFSNVGDHAFASQSDATESWNITRTSGGNISLDFVTGSANALIWNAAFVPTVDTWYHIAIVRIDNGNAATSWRCFINGVSQTLTKTNGNWNDATPTVAGVLKVGNYATGYYMNGYIDELRVSKGVARWTSDFTVPSSAYAPGLVWA